MQEFQINKQNLGQNRIVAVAPSAINNGEVLVKIDRFAFTANNITYAVMGEQLRYWQFFAANDNTEQHWSIIPVWGFADVVESNSDDLNVGERLFGYFPPANELVMTPAKATATSFMEASAHRADLPPGYNMYRRVSNEPGYDRANDNERMLLFVLHLTSFCLYDLLQSNNWYGADQVVIISASSKTSTGLAYGLAADDNAPSIIGLTSSKNISMVESTNSYDSVFSYDNIEQIDASKATVIVDMSANSEVLSRCHKHLGDNMRFTSNVGLTHWEAPHQHSGIISERSQLFFAPSHIQQRMQDWGADTFNQRSMAFIANSVAKSRAWLKIKEIDGIEGLADVYGDVCDGNIAADEGLVVVT